jgi:hypothetical protein
VPPELAAKPHPNRIGVYAPDVVELLIALTSWRITRLLVQDQFPPIAVQRARVAARWGDNSWQAYLSQCPWCAGVYVSASVTAWTWAIVGLRVPLLVWGAAAAVTGLLSSIDAALDKD